MSEGISHWAEKLEIGDKCLATIRHKTDGTKNLHNVEVIVIDNDWEKKEISAWFPEYKVLIPYNELKPKEEKQKIPFEIWLKKLHQNLVMYGYINPETKLSEKDWKVFYDEGLLPSQAIKADVEGPITYIPKAFRKSDTPQPPPNDIV